MYTYQTSFLLYTTASCLGKDFDLVLGGGLPIDIPYKMMLIFQFLGWGGGRAFFSGEAGKLIPRPIVPKKLMTDQKVCSL